jgi:hypothetical protein
MRNGLSRRPDNLRLMGVTLDRAAEILLGLPGVEEVDRRGVRAWRFNEKTIAWERPFSKADLRRFGDDPVPGYPIIGVRAADLAEKEAILDEGRDGFFTIPHFNGYAAYLIELGCAKAAQVREALVDGWLVYAPPAEAARYLKR